MTDWKAIAAAAREARRNAKHGKREAAMSELAPGVDVDVVRRTIRVADFLSEVAVRSDELAEILRSQQFSHLHILAKWGALDVDAAMGAAHEMLRDKPSVRALQASFEAFRRQKGGADEPTRLTPTAPLLAAIGHILDGTVSDPKIRPTVLGARFVDLTLKLNRSAGGSHRAAVMLVGPYTTPRLYVKRAQNALLSAWALAWAFDDVVLALPGKAPIETYQQWLVDARREAALKPGVGPRVHLLRMKPQFYGPRHPEGH
jgi:hypothetical protein